MERILIVQGRKSRKLAPIAFTESKVARLKETFHANNLLDAARIVHNHKPDLVILDVTASSGLDFALFEETKETTYRKIIICDSANYALKVLRYDIDDYLVGHVGTDEIDAAIEKLLFRQNKYSIQQLYQSRKSRNLVHVATPFIPTTTGTLVADSVDIVRVHDLGGYRHIYLEKGREVLTDWPLERLMEVLGSRDFIAVDGDQLVNLAQIATTRQRGERLFAMLTDGHLVKIPFLQEERIRNYRRLAALRPQESLPREGDQ